MKKIFGLVLLTSIVAASAFADDDEPVSQDQLEPVTVKEVSQKGNLMPPTRRPVSTTLTLNVQSGGCTKREDFDLTVEQLENVQQVTVNRLKPDYCEAYLLNGVDIEVVTKQLLPNKKIVVRNPLNVHEQFTH